MKRTERRIPKRLNERGEILILVMVAAAIGVVMTLAMMTLASRSFLDYRNAALVTKAESQVLLMKEVMFAGSTCINTIGPGSPVPSTSAPEAERALPAIVNGSGVAIFRAGEPLENSEGDGADPDLFLTRLSIRPWQNDASARITSNVMVAELKATFAKGGTLAGSSTVTRSFPVLIQFNESTNTILDCVAATGSNANDIIQQVSSIGRCPGGSFLVGANPDGTIRCEAVEATPVFILPPTYVFRPGG